MSANVEILCCGHVCLDVIPRMLNESLPASGALAQVGPADVSTGGSVSNTGLALHMLGVGVRLVGRIGDDLFGQEIRRRFSQAGDGLSQHLLVVPNEPTSYTIVISPPGEDRRFLHCPGVNNSFADGDVPDDAMTGAKLLHFGYPPVMRAMCRNDGEPLVRLFKHAKRRGLLTSLDLCGIDRAGWAGAVDWPALLRKVLPWVDVFMPSADELRDALPDGDDPLAMGCQVLVIKDGERGLSIRTAPQAETLGAGWGDRTLHAATYVVPVAGTTGAGDTTIAGFLAGLVRGESIQVAADLACAAGAHCLAAADATSGLCHLEQLGTFIASDPHRRNP